jgi:uncharacterized protein (DUF2164 family)
MIEYFIPHKEMEDFQFMRRLVLKQGAIAQSKPLEAQQGQSGSSFKLQEGSCYAYSFESDGRIKRRYLWVDGERNVTVLKGKLEVLSKLRDQEKQREQGKAHTLKKTMPTPNNSAAAHQTTRHIPSRTRADYYNERLKKSNATLKEKNRELKKELSAMKRQNDRHESVLNHLDAELRVLLLSHIKQLSGKIKKALEQGKRSAVRR